MRDCNLPIYKNNQPLSLYALRLLKHIISEKAFKIKKWSDDGEYIIKHFLSNSQFWKSAGELCSRNLISVSNLDYFKKFYYSHVYQYTISWHPGEYEKLIVTPTIVGAWVCHVLKSVDNDEI